MRGIHKIDEGRLDKTRRRMPNENRSNFSLRIANEHVIRFTRKYIRKRTSRRRGDTRRTYDNGGVRINILALHVCACVMERRGYRSQLRCINSAWIHAGVHCAVNSRGRGTTRLCRDIV